ncbi:extensin-like domain-containing protein [Paracoccus albus]|uniref:extensin-like domain-containing protein n=1 Tax=Paracoccus albus TaxID=3017784 RepID=UPI0022F0A822|nr:extensin family protein [Paracoccus albus]WBU59800.1 extensin family protein [Paracoccus albus]
MSRSLSLVVGFALAMLIRPDMAVAQDAPPDRPAVERPDGETRPPARPNVAEEPAQGVRGQPDAAGDVPVASEPAQPDDPQSASEADRAARQSGGEAAPEIPAGPPAWQALREDEFSYQSCLLGLSMLGVSFEELAPITSPEDRDCGIARPLEVNEIQPGVTIAGGAVMRCDTARRLALWLRNDAAPAVRLLPGAPRVTEILPGSTYQCRARVGGAEDKLSEHAVGNAFDVAGLRLSDGNEMLISPRNGSGEMAEAVQKAIRYAACLHFTTVLGPGSNAAHDDHLHFDIAARNGGWRLCE